MAARLLRESGPPPDAVRRAFLLCYGREPDAEELRACLSHWKSMTDRHEHLDFEPQAPPREVVRRAIDELSGEPFTFTEELEVYADYVPDLKPWVATPRTRALAELCLILFNSNEFLYVP